MKGARKKPLLSAGVNSVVKGFARTASKMGYAGTAGRKNQKTKVVRSIALKKSGPVIGVDADGKCQG